MKVTAETYGPSVVFACKGELTSDSLGAFQRAIDNQLADSQVRDLVLNLEEVPFVDSASLEYLLELQEKLSERLGQVKLARPDENVVRILKITRLDDAFDRFDDVAEAVKTI